MRYCIPANYILFDKTNYLLCPHRLIRLRLYTPVEVIFNHYNRLISITHNWSDPPNDINSSQSQGHGEDIQWNSFSDTWVKFPCIRYSWHVLIKWEYYAFMVDQKCFNFRIFIYKYSFTRMRTTIQLSICILSIIYSVYLLLTCNSSYILIIYVTKKKVPY